MNKVKFRAWYKPHLDKGIVEMFEQVEIDCELFFVSNKDKEVKYKFDLPFIDDDWIVEQWTGLKDTKSQDIYEGDVLEDEEQTVKFEIRFNKKEAWFCLYSKRSKIFYEFDKSIKSLKVVGNIHEGERK